MNTITDVYVVMSATTRASQHQCLLLKIIVMKFVIPSQRQVQVKSATRRFFIESLNLKGRQTKKEELQFLKALL